LFALGGWLPLRPRRWVRLPFIVLGVAGRVLTYPMAFRQEGPLPAPRWAAAALALLGHGSAASRHPGVTAMISTAQILAAGAITGIAVAVAAVAVRWPLPRLKHRRPLDLRAHGGLARHLEPVQFQWRLPSPGEHRRRCVPWGRRAGAGDHSRQRPGGSPPRLGASGRRGLIGFLVNVLLL
jgi:hypothetical protein